MYSAPRSSRRAGSPARRATPWPWLRSKECTWTPASRATSAVASVEPSSTTIVCTSSPQTVPGISASTVGSRGLLVEGGDDDCDASARGHRRFWPLVRRRCRRLHRARRALAARSPRGDLRPDGLADLGPPDRGRDARHGRRADVEAAARAVHDAVQPGGRLRGDVAVAGRRPRRRPAQPRARLPRRRSAGGGRVAGVVAAVALLLPAEYNLHWLRGNSEGLLVLFALLAVDRHLEGRAWPGVRRRRRRRADPPGRLAAVRPLRPVAAPRPPRPAHRRRSCSGPAPAWSWPGSCRSTSARVTSSAGSRARRRPVPGSPGASGRPFFDVFTNARPGAQLRRLRRCRSRAWPSPGATAASPPSSSASTVLMASPRRLSAGAGFTGSLRYVALPAGARVRAERGRLGVRRPAASRRPVRRRRGARGAGRAARASSRRSTGRGRTSTTRGRPTPPARPAGLHRARGRPRGGPALRRLYTGLFSTQAVAYRLQTAPARRRHAARNRRGRSSTRTGSPPGRNAGLHEETRRKPVDPAVDLLR